MMQLAVLALLLLVWPDPAAAGPVIAAIGAFLAPILASPLGAAIFKTVLGMGLSWLGQKLLAKDQPKPEQPGIKQDVTTQGEKEAQRIILGTYATEGHMNCPPMVFENDEDPNEWMTYVVELCDLPINGLPRMWVDGEEMPLGAPGATPTYTDPTYNLSHHYMGATAPEGHKFHDRVFVRFHDGNQTAADAFLLYTYADYPERPWDASMVLRGTAYAVITFKGRMKDKVFQGGFPSVRFEVRGISLLDPRTGVAGFTENPAVMRWNIVRGITLNSGDVWGYDVPAARISSSHAYASMNACDEQVAIDGGETEPRYRAGYEFSVDEEPASVMEVLGSACFGGFADMGGEIILYAGPPSGSVLSFTDDDISITNEEDLKPFPGLDRLVNALHAGFPDPSKSWEPKEAMPLYQPAYEAEDGRRMLEEVNFQAVPFERQVRRLMREMLADHRRHRNHVVTLPPDAGGVKIGEIVSWTSTFNAYTAKQFQVKQKLVDTQSDFVTLQLREVDPSDFNPNALLDAETPVVPVDTPVINDVTGVQGLTVTPDKITGTGGREKAIIRLTWPVTSSADGIAWEAQKVSDSSLAEAISTQDVAKGTANVQGVLADTQYRVRARWIIIGRETQFGGWITVTTPTTVIKAVEVDTTPPAVPAAPTGTASIGEILFDWPDVTDAVSYLIEVTEGTKTPVVYPAGISEHRILTTKGAAYKARVKALDKFGNTSAYGPMSANVIGLGDSTPPAVPTWKTPAIMAGFGTLWAGWNANTEDDLAGYEVYTSTSVTVPVAGTTPTYTPKNNAQVVTGLDELYTLNFWVRAVDTSGNKSAWSTRQAGTTVSIWATQTDPAAPAAAPSVTSVAQANGRSLVNVSWPTTANANTYGVGIKEGAGNEIVFTAGTNAYSFTTLSGTSVEVRIQGINILGKKSAFSPTATHTAAVDTVAPATPGLPTATGGFGALWLTWPANTEADLSHYEVLMQDAATPAPTLATPGTFKVPGTTMTISGLGYGATKFFWLRAVDLSGNKSAWTTLVNATTNTKEAITNAQLAGLIDATSFAANIEPVKVVTTLPTTKETTLVYYQNKVYRWDASLSTPAYVATTDATMIVGKLQAGQIAAGAIGTDQLAANAVTATKMLLMDQSNLVLDPNLQDTAYWNTASATWWNQAIVSPTAGAPSIGEIYSTSGAGSTNRNVTAGNAAWFSVTPGDVLWSTFYVKRDGGTPVGEVRLQLQYADKDGASLGYFTMAAASAFASDVIIKAVASTQANSIVPAGAVKARIRWFATGAIDGPIHIWSPIIRRRNGGELIVDGALGANHLKTDTAVITVAAQIKAAIIDDAHIRELSAATLKAGTALASTITVAAGGPQLGAIATAATNFNANNDRISAIPTTPGLAATPVSHTLNADGSADLKFQWTFANSTTGANNIDGFIVFVYSATGLSAYTITGTGNNEHPIEVARDQRTVILSGVPADRYFTIGVRSYRVVDSDIAADGILLSPVVQISAPYRPTANVNYTGQLDGTNTTTVVNWASDPAARINAATTKIDPGKITVSGTSTLADWRRGGDETKIDGGKISTNTIEANSLKIGSRGITLTGVRFEHNNPAENQVSWTAGRVNYISDNGTTTNRSINAGSATWTTGVLYIYWTKGQWWNFNTTTDQAVAQGGDNVILATYEGGVKLDADYGRTIVDGSEIKTGTITATQLIKTAELITEQAQVGDAVITDAHIANLNAEKIDAGQMSAQFLKIDELLSIDAENAGLSIGRETPFDQTDGAYFGTDGTGQFGASFGRTDTTTNRMQEVSLTKQDGLRLTNMRFRVKQAGLPQTLQRVAPVTDEAITLPAGTTTVNFDAIGGGGSGGFITTAPAYAAGTAGAATVVKLYDGTTLKKTWTAAGGAGGNGQNSSRSGASGQNSPYGTGGAGGRFSDRTATVLEPSGDGAGNGSGGGGGSGGPGDLDWGRLGGKAGKVVSGEYDVSGFANPRFVVTVGEGAPRNEGHNDGSDGGAGAPGGFWLTYQTSKLIPANVLPLLPTYEGTISKTGLAITFPDHGAGFWELFTKAPNEADSLAIGYVQVDDSGAQPLQIYGGSFASFVSARTPNRVSGGFNSNRTIGYRFYSMEDWG